MHFARYSDRQELVVLMDEEYDMLNRSFVNFWTTHKQHHDCGPSCSKAFVSDGFQKASRFICGNTNMVIDNPELGKLELPFPYFDLVLRSLIHLGLVQIGCGNRPDYCEKRKKCELRWSSRERFQ